MKILNASNLYISPIFYKDILPLIGLCSQNQVVQMIISSNAKLQSSNEKLNTFISLLYKDNQIEINTRLEVERWKGYWNKSKKRIALSFSGLHFRYYKVMNEAYELAVYKVELANLAILNKSLLDRWLNRVSIMLLKKEADLSVSKLRAILLLEADYNAMNKILFNTHLILSLEEYNIIPREIMGG